MSLPGRGAPGSVLVTAFEPFGGARINASAQLASALGERDVRFDVHILPVVAGSAENRAKSVFLARPDSYRWVVSLGEAGPEPEVRLEWIAVNWDDFRIPDNAGQTIPGARIIADGPAGLFSTFDLPGVAQTLEGLTAVPVRLSLSAGNFLCNRLAYSLLNEAWSVPYTFIHVPNLRPETGPDVFNDILDTLAAVCDELENQAESRSGGTLLR